MRSLTIAEARRSAEEKIGRKVDDFNAEKTLEYAKMKLMANGMPEEYLPILYENELLDWYTRLTINLRGAIQGGTDSRNVRADV